MTHEGRSVRTPHVAQLQTYDCGAAALLSILLYFDHDVGRGDLEGLVKPSRDGASLEALAGAAVKLGVPAEARRCSASDVLASRAPGLLHWRHAHYVVYEGVRGGRVRINDPACGRSTMTVEAFRRQFSGAAVVFDQAPDRPLKTTAQRTIGRLVTGLSATTPEALLQACIGFATGLVCGTLFLFMQDRFGAHQPSASNTFAIMLMVSLGVLALATLLRRFHRSRQKHRLRNLAANKLKDGFLSVRHWSSQFATLLSDPDRLFSPYDSDTLKWPAAWTALLGLLLVVPERYLGPFAVFALAVIVASGANLVAAWLKRPGKGTEGFDRAGSAIDAWLLDAVSDDPFLERLQRTPSLRDIILTELRARVRRWERERVIDVLPVLASLVAAAGLSAYAVVVVPGSGSVAAILIAAGALMAITLTTWAPQTATTSASVRQAVVRVLEQRQQSSARPDMGCMSRQAGIGRSGLRLECAAFDFRGPTRGLLKDVTLDIEPGCVVLVLGEPGCGKSVLGQVAAGLLPPDRGILTLDGQPLFDPVDPLDILYVCEEKPFRAGTIMANLQSFREEDGLDEAWIFDNASFASAVGRLKDGSATPIREDGFPLSHGERDRLRLAQVLSAKPRFVVLDEPFRHFTAAEESRAISALRQRDIGALVLSSRSRASAGYDGVFRLAGGRLEPIPIERDASVHPR
ncbi:MAG: cysteine peptidase family C39 domain-containing protein [Pseudomonadota bacterium]